MYIIPFPQKERLENIVTNRLGLYSAGSSDFLQDALDIFFKLRKSCLRKKKIERQWRSLRWLLLAIAVSIVIVLTNFLIQQIPTVTILIEQLSTPTDAFKPVPHPIIQEWRTTFL